ncbi:MAG: hypothetical protein K0S32_4049 [Bacteroidetes bacterium]|jgi:hypothetical protein|nr:hypothetical protein [Bacteroidota bacterium]
MADLKRDATTDKFGREVVRLIREEQFDSYLEHKNHILKTGYQKFVKDLNPNRDKFYNDLEIERAKLFCDLSKEQHEVLNRIVLNILDSVAFNVMRALDENNVEDSGMSLKIDGIEARDIEMIGNGNLSGEYFDWVERFSKHGEFQQ